MTDDRDSPVIAHLINPAAFGGLETVVTGLASGLRAAGSAVVVIVVMDEGSPAPGIVRDLRAHDVPIIPVEVPARRYAMERRHIAQAIRESGASVVHSHGYRMDVMTRVSGVTRGTPWVSTLHGFTHGNLKNRTYEWLQLRALRSAARVIAVSQPIVGVAHRAGIRPDRVELVRNAMAPSAPMARANAQAALSLDPSRRWVGWVGRLGAEKDPGLFARAMEIVTTEDAGVGAVVVGAGPLHAALAAGHRDMIGQGRLVLAGNHAGAGRLMPAFDVLALSSVTEGTPMVVLEAMQAGVPVVATAVGGLPDIIGDGAGVLVAERSAERLAGAIRSVLGDAGQRAAIAGRARERVAAHFSATAWIGRHQELYRELHRESATRRARHL